MKWTPLRRYLARIRTLELYIAEHDWHGVADQAMDIRELVAAHPKDELVDLYPGTGAVGKAWKTWQGKFTVPQFELEKSA